MNLCRWMSFLGVTSCAVSSPEGLVKPGDPRVELARKVAEREVLAVLFVGNSYSFGVPKAFAKAAELRGRKVRTGHATYGGWSLARHARNEPTLRKIRTGGWDVVVLQEQSVIPSLKESKRAARMLPPLRELVHEVRAVGAVPVLYQTWGRRDGAPAVRGDDFHAMSARLRAGYQAAGEELGLVVIPVGEAWEKQFSAGRGRELFLPDGSHPSEVGNQLTAGVFAESLWGK